MKNTIKTFAVTAVTAVLLSYNATAQSVASSLFENAASIMLTRSNEKDNSNALSSIHPRAVEEFQRSFRDVTGEKWAKTSDGYFASFTKDSVQTRVDYNRKGRWLETIRYYGEKKLPADVSNSIKKSYNNYSILGATEVSFDNDPVYMVYIQNESHIKIIGVYQGDMTEVESHKRVQ